MPPLRDALADLIHTQLAPHIVDDIDHEALADALLLEGTALLAAAIGRRAASDQLLDMAARVAVEG